MAEEHHRRSSALERSTGQIVIGWLIRVALGLIALGLVAFEAGGVLIARMTVASTASKAAQEAGFRYRDTSNHDAAEEVAREFAATEGAELIDFSVDAQGQNVIVTLRKKATTLFIHNIGALKKYTTTTATESSPIPT